MSDEKVTLTEEQQHQVFDELSGVDAESAEALAKAEKETEESNYTEATAMEANVDIPGVGIPVTNPKDINEAKEDYLEVMKEYDLTDEEAVSLYNVIRLYKDGNKQGLYDRLPQRLKSIADGIVCNFPMAAPKVKRITKDSAAEFIIESMINDAKINNVFDEYDRDMRNLTNDMDKDFSAIMAEAMNESFENIEKIKETDPVVAARIQAVKDAFAKAEGFDLQLEWLDHISAKKFNKIASRARNEFLYFNKRVNTTSIKVPDITEIPGVIRIVMPEVSEELALKFTLVLVESLIKLPVDDKENLPNLAYIYKLIDNIYKYKFISYVGEVPEAFFGKVKEVISKIDTL